MIEKQKLNENDFTSGKEYEIFILNARCFGSLIGKGAIAQTKILAALAYTNADQIIDTIFALSGLF